MMKKFLITAFLLAFFAPIANASKLPDDFWTYIRSELPNASQRFDSVITLPNGALYIPLYPAMKAETGEIMQEYSYPSNMKLKALPEVAIFNNNFVLLKVFKDKGGNYTLTKNENLPMKVRMGVMPQDMLVPVGLTVPTSLKVVLGDLEVPQKTDGSIALDGDDKTSRKQAHAEFGQSSLGVNFVPLNELKSKKIFVSTNASKFLNVYDGASKEALYELKLNSLPSKILASTQTKFALVVYFANKTLEIVDLATERVISKIEIEGTPKDAEIDQLNNLAYVSSAEASAIYVIDLNSAKLVREIKLGQSPNKIAISDNTKSLAFIDHKSQELYSLDLEGEYISKYIAKTTNVSKVIAGDGKIYTISRTDNKLHVYDVATATLLGEHKISEKPVDALKYGEKIFILCAKNGVMDVYDIVENKIVKTQNLDNNGFYSKITKVPNQANAVITGIGAKKFLLFNLENLNVTRKQPFEVDVSNIIMIDK